MTTATIEAPAKDQPRNISAVDFRGTYEAWVAQLDGELLKFGKSAGGRVFFRSCQRRDFLLEEKKKK